MVMSLVLLISLAFLFIAQRDQSHLSSEIINLPGERAEETFSKLLENDQKLINNALSLIDPLVQTIANQAEESQFSEFSVDEGIIKNLSLRFLEESWVEIYQGNNQLIFKTNENLEISITPPFKIIVGNARGIVGFYNQNEINFTQVANKLNVSSIEIDNE